MHRFKTVLICSTVYGDSSDHGDYTCCVESIRGRLLVNIASTCIMIKQINHLNQFELKASAADCQLIPSINSEILTLKPHFDPILNQHVNQ